jgi:hypothetical protein
MFFPFAQLYLWISMVTAGGQQIFTKKSKVVKWQLPLPLLLEVLAMTRLLHPSAEFVSLRGPEAVWEDSPSRRSRHNAARRERRSNGPSLENRGESI